MTTGESQESVIRFSEHAINLAERRAVEAAPHEIGGILIGWWEASLRIAVVHDLIVVPDRQPGVNNYTRRQAPAQQALSDHLHAAADPRLGYVGEWHSHPEPQGPSLQDRTELAALVRQTHHAVAMVVLACTPVQDVTLHALVGRPRWPRRVALDHATTERGRA